MITLILLATTMLTTSLRAVAQVVALFPTIVHDVVQLRKIELGKVDHDGNCKGSNIDDKEHDLLRVVGKFLGGLAKAAVSWTEENIIRSAREQRPLSKPVTDFLAMLKNFLSYTYPLNRLVQTSTTSTSRDHAADQEDFYERSEAVADHEDTL
ncbi:unnamed protein product [Amoebophrya sp. A25]|nr:unnamed protein product [Amoebophrya sp. A25]|eukprot:GSA25T00009783001.1